MILIIDDDSHALQSYIMELEFNNYQVKTENHPDDALATIEQLGEGLSLIILDLMMPIGDNLSFEEAGGGMNTGLVLLKKIRKLNISLPVIVFTIRVDRKLDNELKELNVKKILRKTDILPYELVREVQLAGILPNVQE